MKNNSKLTYTQRRTYDKDYVPVLTRILREEAQKFSTDEIRERAWNNIKRRISIENSE